MVEYYGRSRRCPSLSSSSALSDVTMRWRSNIFAWSGQCSGCERLLSYSEEYCDGREHAEDWLFRREFAKRWRRDHF